MIPFKKYKKYLLMLIDMILIFGVHSLCFFVMKMMGYPSYTRLAFFESLSIIIIVFGIVFNVCKLYDNLWRYAGIGEFVKLVFAAAISKMISAGLCFIIFKPEHMAIFWIAETILIATALSSFRVMYRLYKMYFIDFHNGREQDGKKRCLIVGAGWVAVNLIEEMKIKKTEYLPVAMVDDSIDKQHRLIGGVKVYGTIDTIPELCNQLDINCIIIATTFDSQTMRERIYDLCEKTSCDIKIVQDTMQLLNNSNILAAVKKININDLLCREPVLLDQTCIKEFIQGQTVLITGGGGSIGSELCRQIALFCPQKLIILDIYENNAYAIQQELVRKYGDALDLSVEIASVRDFNKLDIIFKRYRPNIVFHAAAHKHVPLMETNPEEAIKNNIFGTLNTVKCSDTYGVNKFILVSTDKAVNPTNVMGATKRFAEMIIQNYNKHSKTEFASVRFGNVLGSNGSVIPLFEKQITDGGPVTVTHPEINRFFMTIPEAVQLVLSAGSMAKGSEIFVLDMGKPVKIDDLARKMIRLSGLIPDKDIKICYTGLRQGEKLYEEVLMDCEELQPTTIPKIKIGKQVDISDKQFNQNLKLLSNAIASNNVDIVIHALQQAVPTYQCSRLALTDNIVIYPCKYEGKVALKEVKN